MDYIRSIGEALNSYYGVLGSKRKALGPQELRRWNHMFLVLCVIALSLDPLLCYILVFNDERKCLRLDTTLGAVAIVLRSIIDLFYIVHIIFQFRASIAALSSQPSGPAEFLKEFGAKAWKYLLLYFPVDMFVVLPLPQVVIFAIVPKLNDSRFFSATKSLNFIVIFQYVLRVLRICSLLNKVTNISGILAETAWANLFLYMLASHVVGAFWYLFSVQRKATCWLEACRNHAVTYCSLYCDDNLGAITFLNDSCSTRSSPNSSVFDFGIYFNALESGVVDSDDFVQKISYCFWWGLQNLSSLGQGLRTSTYVWEIYYAVFVSISGLVLFSSLIGNMQTYLQLRTARLAEIRLKEREREYWMTFYTLPQNLKKRIREYQKDLWQENMGVNIESFLLILPRDLRSDTKRCLCLSALRRVPFFDKMDEQLLDAMLDSVKPVLFTDESYIVREGDQVDQMYFIMRGRLLSKTTNGGRSSSFFNSWNLKAGDFCGEELLAWSLNPNSSNLPISRFTVQALNEVEAFALKAEDLKILFIEFRRLHPEQRLHKLFRFFSPQWRTWAACYIQAAWRRYNKKKLQESLREAENRLQDALTTPGGSSPSLGATIYASRFAANALRAVRRNVRPGRALRVGRPGHCSRPGLV